MKNVKEKVRQSVEFCPLDSPSHYIYFSPWHFVTSSVQESLDKKTRR